MISKWIRRQVQILIIHDNTQTHYGTLNIEILNDN